VEIFDFDDSELDDDPDFMGQVPRPPLPCSKRLRRHVLHCYKRGWGAGRRPARALAPAAEGAPEQRV
jgi:hypothetical protein